MPTIIPRWEWRTFGPRFGAAEAALRRPDARRHPGERRALPPLRGRRQRQGPRRPHGHQGPRSRSTRDGLEQWRPVMKAAFPLAARRRGDASSRRSACRVPPLAREAYTLDQFVAELAEPGGADARRERPQAARPLHGRRLHRRGLRRGRRRAARPGRSPSSRRTRPRSSPPSGRWASAATSTPATRGASRRSLDGTPARYAVIDVGHELGQVPRRRARRRRDLADGRRPGRADPARRGPRGARRDQRRGARADGRRPSPAWSTRRRRDGALAIAAVGTAGLRIADNSDEVVAAIAARTGVTVEVISGEEESRLAYLAVKAGLGLAEGSLVVFDTGGGSTQFTFGQGARVDERFSVDVGAVRYTERFGLAGVVTPEVLAEALAAIAADLSRIDGRPAPDALVGDGRRGHEHHGGEARARHLRPGRRPGHASSTGPRSTARSSSTGRATSRRGGRSSASSRSGPT